MPVDNEVVNLRKKGNKMTNLTQKKFLGTAVRVLALALFLVVVRASTGLNTVTAIDDQVPFTGTATGVVTSIIKLPGGMTQINLNTKGNATHLGDFTGASTRIEDNQGNAVSAGAFIAANGQGRSEERR